MFEKAHVGGAATIMPIRPSRVLLAVDGSGQDIASIAAANDLRKRFNVETLVLDPREGQDDASDLATKAAADVSGARPLKQSGGDSYERILAAVRQHDVDLLVVPCPFGRSFENIGVDSVGTVIDVLLSRCPCPILVTRREDQSLADCAGHVSMVVGGECDVENRAAGWAFGLAAPQATVTLNLVIEKEEFDNIRSIVEALAPDATLDPDQFAEALQKTHSVIHSSMAKTASARGVTYHLLPQAGHVAPPSPLDDARKMLIVLPLEVDDRYGQGFVQDRIRRSPHPVLVVPGHVTSSG
jgi:nucleotide-binding universal stress UspA family protein